VVQVFGVATAELRDLTVTGGNSVNEPGAGGGIFASRNATLTLTRVLVTDNTAAVGGGIYNGTSLILNATTVTDNTATTSGGGIYNDGTLILNAGSSISGNTPDQCVNNAGTGCP
jgi:predicted outer membrane repeat protein